MVPGAGIEPARYQIPRDFKSLASTNSATQANNFLWGAPYNVSRCSAASEWLALLPASVDSCQANKDIGREKHNRFIISLLVRKFWNPCTCLSHRHSYSVLIFYLAIWILCKNMLGTLLGWSLLQGFCCLIEIWTQWELDGRKWWKWSVWWLLFSFWQ